MAGWRVERVLGAPRFVPNLLLRGIYATVFGVLELAFWSANRLAGLVSRSSIPNVDAAMDWSDLQTLRLPLSRPFLAADVLTINGPPSRDGQLTHVIFPGNPAHDQELFNLPSSDRQPAIGTTPRGQQLYPILRYGRRWVVQVAELLGRLPTAWQWTLSQKVMGHDVCTVLLLHSCHARACLLHRLIVNLMLAVAHDTNASQTGLDMVAAALSLMPAKVGGNCLYMGYTEMEGLRDFDLSLTKPVEESLTWYFAQTDGWVTTSHVQDIEEACPASTIMHDTLVGRLE
ncbi:uncharacterized protein MONBRDRAFT_36861 [Monosiga brevicollis MX1]|uniref:Uncharacterized protein n=1 Tax=Monosiga brevicollis TaxID=81824 RepID=A9UY95_MONBE|nr:uncharacterized protein MONBRDRAFT_36861 [Monosiga brevicollis MX1]EDQ89984.1 predicted protein [Monosiga brevicollis MX1]|eukprot:XP_001745406.1 hypothetical protein [Monosiga brevicollis MX1]